MTDVKIPRENANDDFVLITKIHVQVGDKVETGDVIFEFETSKASIEFEASNSGYVTHLSLQEGAEVAVNTIVASISDQTNDASTVNPAREETPVNTNADVPVFASDAALLLMKEGKKTLKNQNWVTTKDFNGVFPKHNHKDAARPRTAVPNYANENELNIPYELISIDRRKKAEIKSLGTSSTFYNSTLGISFDMPRRHVVNDFFTESILDLVVYETTLLLKTSFPDLNACFVGNDKVARFNEVIAGVALDDVNNLTVAALTDTSNLSSLSDEIINLIIRFQDKDLRSSDLKSTTFTVTDLSNLEIDFVLPLINGSQGFILGIAKNDTTYHIFGSFDHRITEGKRFASFLVELRDRILLYALPNDRNGLAKKCAFCLKTVQEEKALGNRGLLKIDDGYEDKLVCRNCYEGW